MCYLKTNKDFTGIFRKVNKSLINLKERSNSNSSKFFKETVISGCIDPMDVRKDNYELQGGDIINKGDEQ